jgi:acyl-CoA thioester hydrolase
VYYGDTDQMGVVYYANYLRWFEMARNEYLRAIGFPYARLEEEGVVLPVVDVGARYLKPARYDDQLTLEAWITWKSKVRVRFAYRIWKTDSDTPITEGYTVHASVDRAGTPRRLPASLLEALHVVPETGPPARSGC